MVFCSCEIGGLWRRSKSMWGNFLSLAHSEMSKIDSLRLLRGFMSPT
jgi:hypothetical protein